MKKLLMTIACLALVAVPAMAAKVQVWTVPGDFATIQDAIDSPDVEDGDVIRIGPKGSYAGALVDKAVTIEGTGQAVIDDGPAHSSGNIQGFRLLAGSDGATFKNLTFEVDFPIMNGDGVDGVTVDHCTCYNALQGISNWRGSWWEITHNTFVDLRSDCGGGIAIFVGDFSGGEVEGNLIDHNDISGTLHVAEDDCGGYSGTGIVLYADFRWEREGASNIFGNVITHNDISLVSDTPDVVDVVAIELTDTQDDSTLPAVIVDNVVGFNDMRGTATQLALTPSNLEDENIISRNLGENRGHGVHPAAFR